MSANEKSLVNKCINKYCKKVNDFRSAIKQLANSYQVREYYDMLERYSMFVQNTIQEVAEIIFPKESGVQIYLSGSFARGIGRTYSDLDVSCFYKYFRKYYRYEEIFCYTLCKIFGFIRFKVHNIMLFSAPIRNFIKSPKIEYFVDGHKIEECIHIELDLNYNCSKYLKDFKKYIYEHNLDYIKEWMMSIIPVIDDGNILERWQKDILNYNKMNIHCLNALKESIRGKIKSYMLITFEKFTSSQKLKKSLKKYPLDIIYSFFIYYMLTSNIPMQNNLRALIKTLFQSDDEFIKKVMHLFSLTYMDLDNLDIFLRENNINFSTHSTELLNLPEINKHYFAMHGVEQITTKILNNYKQLFTYFINYIGD